MASPGGVDDIVAVDEVEEEEGCEMHTDGPQWKRVASKRSADDSQLPKSVLRPAKLTTEAVTTRNRFDVLQTQQTDGDSCRPPPIHINDVEINDYRSLMVSLKDTPGATFQCQATNKNRVTVYPTDPASYRLLVHRLRELGRSFHSYQLENEKAYRVVLRHLHPSIEPDEIKTELERLSFKVRSVTNVLQAGTRIPLPLFFVDLEPDDDNARIFTVNSMLYTRIKVEEPRKKNDLVQCKRCMQFGHTRGYCNHPPICARCGAPHYTGDCNRNRDDLRICAHCQGNHSSTYKGCMAYKELRSKKNRNTGWRQATTSYQQGVSSAGRQSLQGRQVYDQNTNPDQTNTNTVNQHAPRHNQHTYLNQTNTNTVNKPAPLHEAQVLQNGAHITQHNVHSTVSPHVRIMSPRDPRTPPRSFAEAVAAVPRRISNVRPQAGSPPSIQSQDPNEHIMNTFNAFLTRFQDLIMPLVSTLTLLVNKLLTTHG